MVAPLKYRTTGDDRFIGALIFLMQFHGSRFFSVCSIRGKWNFSCQPCEPRDKRRGEDGIVGVVRCVFLTRLIGEVGGWRKDENSGTAEWSELWECLTVVPFSSALLFFFFLFLSIESAFYIYTSTFKSLVEIGFWGGKGDVLEKYFFYRVFLFSVYFEKFCLRSWGNFNWEILEGDFRIWIYFFDSI